MDFDDQKVDTSRVDDVRSSRGLPGGLPGLAAGGGGVVALVVTLLIVLLGGGTGGPGGALDPSVVSQDVLGGSAGSSASDLSTRCATEGAIDTYDDCYLVKVFNETDEVWRDEFAARGLAYRPARLTFYRDQVRTACGAATSQVGPFYCPGDERIYLDIDFLGALQREFGAEGRYAQAYIVAHEFGHHLQTVRGTEAQVRAQQRRNPNQADRLSVAMELQADCLAGAWGGLADERGNVTVGQDEIAQAQDAAAAVGDDRIQQRTSGRVDPESWTHGSAADRRQWFVTGFQSKDLSSCNTLAT